MKLVKNTLYVTLEGAWVHKEGEAVTIHKEHSKVAQFPLHQIGEIVCFGFGIGVSPNLTEHCASKGVTITYVDGRGKFLARMQGPVHGNVLLRRSQYRIADNPEMSLSIAKCCIAAKIQNQRNVLLRHLRNHPNCDGEMELKSSISAMEHSLTTVKNVSEAGTLRGIEGDAADRYFSVFNYLILNKDSEFVFKSRNRRPPMDRINAMLSYAYSILALDIRSALECVGLDPYVGFLHVDRPGRPSLALDLMEEFRAPIADRLVLSLVNLKQVNSKGFKVQPNGEVEMNDETRKTLLAAWQKRKTEELYHPLLEESMQTGMLYVEQARLLAKCVRGDIEYYPAYLWR
ncbi:type I-C CRISPR-associated endonuclease Cas1c [Fibrobacter sp. UWEL]|uniref:type I-C CRISPR-associated endonuclease Cas1c n=1 Tax=Fibrobacter sp. UWEL TaxID=1896209 RepID=UPI00091C2300|nr:type I-C CRISPR-associated endonuclease Cas1c [Fibrobacter sp. UWEL]SHK60013.1 CRISPR-associated protein, Cas1 family [Fibrobacter sp. UWEL]